MTDLESYFSDGTLVRPSDRHPNLVHLVRALATAAGVPDLDAAPATRQILDSFGSAQHVIFVLCDGLGLELIRRLPPDAFLARHLRMELHATCPSTTACALTTVATAQYPNRHGVCGWFTHLPEFDLTATVLPFADRFTNQPLASKGIQPQQVLPAQPICPRMTHHAMTLVPALIANTTYNIYTRGGTEGHGYHSIHNGVDHAISHVMCCGDEPTYTHLYLPEVDMLCHKLGTAHDNVLPLVRQIDAELTRLHAAVSGRATLVVSADHGLINVPASSQTLLMHDDPLLALLRVPPTGDARLPIFHVKEGRREAFFEAFNQRFADRFVLLPTDDAERLELFGPGPMAPAAKGRFGDFIGIAYKPATLAYHPPNKPLGHLYLGVHAGLSPEEMWVPLVVAV